nr:ABC transporter substrate-binding protein [Pseudonocardia sp. ICBG601]
MLRRLIVLLALAGLLTACASDPGPAAGPSGSDGAFPVRIDHLYGTTEIPARPERIVTLGVTDIDPVLALGVTPVATTSYPAFRDTDGVGPWGRDLVRGTPPQVLAEPDATPSLERLAALAPDVIIAVTSGIDQATYDRLSAIAPVVARPAGTIAYGVPRSDQTRTVAAALGEPARGEELVRTADAAFAEAVAAHPEFRGAVAPAVLPYDGKYGAFTPADARGQFMSGLGFALPERIAALDDGTSFYVELSSEQAGLLDGDALVVLADEGPARRQVDTDPVLAQVPVVARGDMIIPDADVRAGMTYNSVLSAPYALERLVPQLAGKLGG